MGLHQNCEIGSVDLTDTWEPLEEGLSRVETTRHVSVVCVQHLVLDLLLNAGAQLQRRAFDTQDSCADKHHTEHRGTQP